MIKFVVGFMFNEDYTKVVLIQKNRPRHFAGKYNGVGGKIEPEDRGSFKSMQREFLEEAGMDISNWTYYVTKLGIDFSVEVFYAAGDISKVSTKTDEPIEIHDVDNLPVCVEDVIGLVSSIVAVRTKTKTVYKIVKDDDEIL